jgi:flagellar protein FlaF
VSPNSLAQRAYAQASTPIRTARGTEYQAIVRITHRLKAAAQKGKAGFNELVEALHDNRKLWTLLATDVADPDNKLPKEIRARIFYLAEFTQLHSSKVLTGGVSVRPLLEINTAILRGLRQGSTES